MKFTTAFAAIVTIMFAHAVTALPSYTPGGGAFEETPKARDGSVGQGW